MTLLSKQQLFARLLSQLVAWIFTHPTWAVTMGEGFVGKTDGMDGDHDGPHMTGGAHYNQLGQDLNLFVSGVYVTSAHPAWDEIGATWKGLHDLARWGGDFQSRDFNHFSLTHDGFA